MNTPTGIFTVIAETDRYTYLAQGAALTIETARTVADDALKGEQVKSVGEWATEYNSGGLPAGASREVRFVTENGWGHVGSQTIAYTPLTAEPVSTLTPRDFAQFYVTERDGSPHRDTGHNLDSTKCKRPNPKGRNNFDPCRMCSALAILDENTLTAMDFVRFYLNNHGDPVNGLIGHAPESTRCRVPSGVTKDADYECRMCAATSLLAASPRS